MRRFIVFWIYTKYGLYNNINMIQYNIICYNKYYEVDYAKKCLYLGRKVRFISHILMAATDLACYIADVCNYKCGMR